MICTACGKEGQGMGLEQLCFQCAMMASLTEQRNRTRSQDRLPIPAPPERLHKASRNNVIVHRFFSMPMEREERLERIIEMMAERQQELEGQLVRLLKRVVIPPGEYATFMEFIRGDR